MLFAILVTSQAFAGSQDNVELSSVEVAGPIVALTAKDGWASSINDSCDGFTTIQFDGTTPAGQLMYRQVLAGFLAKRPFYIETSGCIGPRPLVSKVRIK